MCNVHPHNLHAIDGFGSTQSQLSQDAADRHAVLTALREGRRNRRHPVARRLGLAPRPQHSRRRRARIGRIDQPSRASYPISEVAGE
jgi:hypothetical protein